MQPQPYDFETWGWFEPVSYRYGESLVERCRKERDKPAGWSDKARPLFSFSCAGDETYRVDYDGFVGTKQGVYVTREGRVGVVLQQVGTKGVHVYNSVRAVLLAKTERAEDDKQNSVDPSSVLLAQPHGMRLPLRDAIARAIIGPRKAVPPTSKFSLDELRAVSWRRALESERRDALSAADAILRIFEGMFT